MPQPFKRNADTPASINLRDSPSGPSKRRRVSRACDACRSAKDKCDGVKPRCQRCISLGRQCTYSDPEKRRGIRTGYLRAIELALAYLLDTIPACESVLLTALNDHEEGQRRVFADRDSPSGEALLKRWQRSEVYQGIDRLISGEDTTPRVDVDADTAGSIPRPFNAPEKGAELSGDMSAWRQAPFHSQHQHQHHDAYDDGPDMSKPPPDLPPNFRHYLDIYLTYSHCWFPVVEKESLMRVASSYPHTDFGLDSRNPAYATPSELWGALAVGAALDSQGSSMGAHSATRGLSTGTRGLPTAVYPIARQLIPGEDGVLGESHVRSLLLLAVAKLSQGELNTAWLLIGQAVRLQLQLPRQTDAQQPTTCHSDMVASMGCFILDTFVSLRLGRPPQTRRCDFPDPSQLQLQCGDYHERWNTRSPQSGSYSIPPSPLASLVQQYKFARVLSQHFASSSSTGAPTPQGSGPVNLVQALDPPFHFCNALVHGGLTPRAPGAFLVHAGFLTSSILVSPASLPRLASSLLDVVGHCVSTLGAYGLSPLFSVYLTLAIGEGRVEYLKADERDRMAELIQKLKHRPGGRPFDQGSYLPPTQSGSGRHPPMEDRRPEQRSSDLQLGTEDTSTNTFYHLGNPLDNPSTYFSPHSNTSQPTQHVAANTVMHSMLSGSLGSESSVMMNMGTQEDFPLDYDAILDELSSLDYVDNIEPDPQFMVNLGFAPGCELNEMFTRHFGSL